MKAKIELKLKPFTVPKYAVAETSESGGPDGTFPLSMLDAETLDKLCDDFRDAVFKQAGKHQPTRNYCASKS